MRPKYRELIKASHTKICEASQSTNKKDAEKLMVHMAVAVLISVYANRSDEAKHELLDELSDALDIEPESNICGCDSYGWLQ